MNLPKIRPSLTKIAALALITLFLTMVRLDIKWHLDGLFLLRGEHGWRFELKDDLYVGDADRLLYALDWETPLTHLHALFGPGHRLDQPHIDYTWDTVDGSGYFRNHLGGGRQLATSFGRYRDDEHEYVHGLFVGGGLPHSVTGDNAMMNESGMSYYDGHRWYHIWCNVNEAIGPVNGRPIAPSRWKFLGSTIIDKSDSSPVITSRHEVSIDSVPLEIDRTAYLFAGETYFILDITIINRGTSGVSYRYGYGDEPWLGDYGTSRGDVGWVKDQLIQYETIIDSKRHAYAGMFHYGNDAINEGHQFTGLANFIEWFGPEVPLVYFSNNEPTAIGLNTKKVPLASNERYIGLQWGPREIMPGEAVTYRLAVGMAGLNPKTGMPQKPPVKAEAGYRR